MDNFVIELFLLSIGASFVQRTTGFGFGIFIMTMLPSIMPSYGEATTLSGILAMTTSLIIVIQKYKYITWRRLLPILFTFIIISIGAIFVLEAAAILHDVGIHVSEARYGNCDGKHQEELGPDEARKVLSEVDGFTAAQTERICWLIAHHHTYKDVTSLDHRILLEADFLVNSFEDHLAPEGIITFRDHVFRSESAIRMLNDMWGLE